VVELELFLQTIGKFAQMCNDDVTVIIEAQEDFTTVVIENDCEDVTIISNGLGANGLSAYEIAVANGFVGTEEEWLESLKPVLTLVTSGFGENLEYDAETQTLTIDKYNWMDLARGYTQKPTLYGTTSTGRIYEYIYQTRTLYRYIATDLSQDAFYDDDTLSNRLCTKKISL
jgi:hypothetical protein